LDQRFVKFIFYTWKPNKFMFKRVKTDGTGLRRKVTGLTL